MCFLLLFNIGFIGSIKSVYQSHCSCCFSSLQFPMHFSRDYYLNETSTFYIQFTFTFHDHHQLSVLHLFFEPHICMIICNHRWYTCFSVDICSLIYILTHYSFSLLSFELPPFFYILQLHFSEN